MKKKTKGLEGFRFCTFIGRCSSDITAVKGLTSTGTTRLIRDREKGGGGGGEGAELGIAEL